MPELDRAPPTQGLESESEQVHTLASLLAMVRAEQVAHDEADTIHGHLEEAAHHLRQAMQEADDE